ncbi:MAG TPA: hypothetical protein VG742_20525 [Dongiaceae bacterium]|nr:hypothetical protein [Dongiaceae bacterium]
MGLLRLAPRMILVGLAAAWLAGCVPESEHPIAPADPAKSDARLWGTWISTEEDGYLVAHVFATEAGAMKFSIAEHGVEGLGEVETYDGHVTHLESGDYINAVVTGSEAGYVIGKYEVADKDHLSVWFPESAALVQAVKDKKLAGTITDDGGIPDVRITATSEEWQAFLAGALREFYGQPTSFERVGPAYVSE